MAIFESESGAVAPGVLTRAARQALETRWGGYPFSSPIRFRSTLLLPPGGGIYAVTDSASRPLYFGECGDFSKRLTTRHEKLASWVKAAKGSGVFIAVHRMYGASAEERKTREGELIQQYNPPCNLKGSAQPHEGGALLRARRSHQAPESLSGWDWAAGALGRW